MRTISFFFFYLFQSETMLKPETINKRWAGEWQVWKISPLFLASISTFQSITHLKCKDADGFRDLSAMLFEIFKSFLLSNFYLKVFSNLKFQSFFRLSQIVTSRSIKRINFKNNVNFYSKYTFFEKSLERCSQFFPI